MNKKLPLIVLFFFACALFAQNANPQVAPIIEKTAQKYKALSSFSINYKMSRENNKKMIQDFEGVLLVKKDKYFLTFDDQIIANDGEMMWNYQRSINEVSVFEAADDDFSIFHPVKVLDNWNKEYEAKFIREEEFQKKLVTIIDLRPKKQSSFYKIRFFIDKNTSYVQQIMMYEMDNTITTYKVNIFTPNAVVADTKFIFNKNDYPDVQINDMR